MIKKCLNENWTIKFLSSDKNIKSDVPVSDYNALLKNKIIENPYFENNEIKYAHFAEEEKIFEKTFNVTEDELKHNYATVECDMIDTLADLFVNGKYVKSLNNAFVPLSENIKSFLRIGTNTIKFHFKSPVKYAKEKQNEKPLPSNSNGLNGISYIRKPACHFGWDWGINLPISGIIKAINLSFYDSAITDFDVTQSLKGNTANVTIKLETVGDPQINGKIICPNGDVIPLEFNNNTSLAVIKDPELWWTKELNGKEKQPLYEIIINDISKKIGIRTVELNRQKDEYGENFQFVLNGVPLFAKGASLIPPDAIIDRVNKEKLNKLVDDALTANFNMIRIWGGGYYGSDEFFDLCDEKGILVWQDFMFACLMYPFYDPEFSKTVSTEIECNIKRIKTHPSLALWCGNNEIEFMFSYLPQNTELVKSYVKFFYETLPTKLNELDSQTPYTQTSPTGNEFRKNITADGFGDTHMWHVWHGSQKLDYYSKRFTRFCSEFGMESLPSKDCIKEFTHKNNLKLNSKELLTHQKCANGNEKLLFYLLEKFNSPKNFDDLIYITQLTQMDCIKNATEHFRRNKGRCNGSLWWQYNDCWNTVSWSSVDFTGKWKALMYASKEFNAPITITISENKGKIEIYLLNDTLKNKKFRIIFGAMSFNGNELFKKAVIGNINANSVKKAVSFSAKNLNKKNTAIFAKLILNGKTLCTKTFTMLPEKRLNLCPAKIKKSISENTITLTSDTFAKSVFIDIANDNQILSKNCFDLMPNEAVTVELQKPINRDKITIKCVNNVKYKKSTTAYLKNRLLFSLKPANMTNRIYYSVS